MPSLSLYAGGCVLHRYLKACLVKVDSLFSQSFIVEALSERLVTTRVCYISFNPPTHTYQSRKTEKLINLSRKHARINEFLVCDTSKHANTQPFNPTQPSDYEWFYRFIIIFEPSTISRLSTRSRSSSSSTRFGGRWGDATVAIGSS